MGSVEGLSAPELTYRPAYARNKEAVGGGGEVGG